MVSKSPWVRLTVYFLMVFVAGGSPLRSPMGVTVGMSEEPALVTLAVGDEGCLVPEQGVIFNLQGKKYRVSPEGVQKEFTLTSQKLPENELKAAGATTEATHLPASSEPVVTKSFWRSLFLLGSPTPELYWDLKGKNRSLPFNGIKSYVSFARTVKNRVWFGFKFISTHDYDGLGGMGFFDTKTGANGLLRHPALVNRSVSSFEIKKGILRLEAYNSACGTCDQVEDQQESAQKIERIWIRMTDLEQIQPKGKSAHVAATIQSWSSVRKKQIKTQGAEAFMVDQYQREIKPYGI